jgi:predicted nucleic acid-binding protein
VKTSTLIDTNILIDAWGPPGGTAEWSKSALAECHGSGVLVVNSIIWSELAPLIVDEPALEGAAAKLKLVREFVPWNAAFLAGETHARYRRAGGSRERTLPDFLIGAHAVVLGYRVLTRDPKRYRAYFPDLEIIAPDTHP